MRTLRVARLLLPAALVGSVAVVGAATPAWTAASLQSVPRANAAIAPPGSSHHLKIVLLGSGMGPRVDLAQFGASTLIEAGEMRLLFDCGRGATLRLTQVGVPIGTINRLFLTHLHSDHVIQIPDLLLTGWAGGGRSVPLEVWGPDGTQEMMRHLQEAFGFDIHMRRDVDEKRPADGIKVLSHDIAEGVVFDEQGVKVTAFLVDHGLLKPALGYRVDYAGHSVVLSGDTRATRSSTSRATLTPHDVTPPRSRPASCSPGSSRAWPSIHTDRREAR
jgi:ribonuclease Z